MIGKISGILLEKNPPQVLIDCSGVGYEVDVPMSTFYQLPDLGQTTALHTHFITREDAQLLFGFATIHERSVFKQLIKISGIGPRIALAILSGMNVNEFALAIHQQDATRLSKIPGIGKKTAERLILELKNKIKDDVLNNSTSPHTHATRHTEAWSATQDIEQALLALGYGEKEATQAIKILPPDVAVSEGIKLALKYLS